MVKPNLCAYDLEFSAKWERLWICSPRGGAYQLVHRFDGSFSLNFQPADMVDGVPEMTWTVAADKD